MKKLLAFASMLLLAATAYAGDFADISITDLKAAIESKKVVLIDVNGTESWQKGHIPGAIDFAANKAVLATMLPKEKDALIVAYCGGPKCKAYLKAAAVAKELGYTNIKHLKAGISGWVEAKQQTEAASTPAVLKTN